MKKLILVPLVVAMLYGCAGVANNQAELSLAENKQLVVGVWAMMPLRNGIANVVEYRADGKSKLHSFNCTKPGETAVEESVYTISEDGKTISVSSPYQNFDLRVLSFKRNAMKLAMTIEGMELQFSYLKTSKIAPLCALYEREVVDKEKNMPYRSSDFVASPEVPESPNIDQYVGRWADSEGAVQFEVVKDARNRTKLSRASSENWHYLYNDLSWSGNELHFQSFAYSEKEDLFKHSYHKSKIRMILAPMADANKLKHSFFIGDRRFDVVLIKVKN